MMPSPATMPYGRRAVRLHQQRMTQILLIDDDQDLSVLLGEYLTRDGFHVTTAADGGSGVTEALSGHHALVILDVMLPRLNGLEVLRRIRQESNLPVLMLTARGDDADCVAGLELGADDYVTKPCPPRTLVARVRAVLRRVQPPVVERTPERLSCGELELWPEQRRVQWEGEPLRLTSTEFSLLELLMRQAGRAVTKAELSDHALGRPLARHDRSIDVHVSALRRKLGTLPDGRSRIQTVQRIGYLLVRE